VKVAVIITGSLRDKHHFDRVMRGVLELKTACTFVHEVRLSTCDEPNSFRNEIKEWQRRLEFQTIRSEPPKVVVKGHRLHQLRQLEAALQGLEAEEWVMKIRTDKLLLPVELMKSCIEKVAADPQKFADKFGVLEGHVLLPWFINDMAYFGQVASLQEMLSFDTAVDTQAPNLATEQVIWGNVLGSESADFFATASKFPLSSQLNPEKLSFNDHDRAFNQIKPILRQYWSLMQRRFFSIAGRRCKELYRLKVSSLDVTSNCLFTRYGKWGTSFIDTEIFGDLAHSLV